MNTWLFKTFSWCLHCMLYSYIIISSILIFNSSLWYNVIHFHLIAALKIHMSQSTMEILRTRGSFIIEDRGIIEIKVCTYVLFISNAGIYNYHYHKPWVTYPYYLYIVRPQHVHCNMMNFRSKDIYVVFLEHITDIDHMTSTYLLVSLTYI